MRQLPPLFLILLILLICNEKNGIDETNKKIYRQLTINLAKIKNLNLISISPIIKKKRMTKRLISMHNQYSLFLDIDLKSNGFNQNFLYKTKIKFKLFFTFQKK